MARLQYFSYPVFRESSRKNVGHSQAGRIGDQIIISGQGGWDRNSHAIYANIDEEIDQAFDNVDHCLKDAGGKGWSQVYHIRVYLTEISEESMGALVRNIKSSLSDHQPILTAVGVSALSLPGMRFDIEVKAHDPEGSNAV